MKVPSMAKEAKQSTGLGARIVELEVQVLELYRSNESLKWQLDVWKGAVDYMGRLETERKNRLRKLEHDRLAAKRKL
jgi:hypothetical protein